VEFYLCSSHVLSWHTKYFLYVLLLRISKPCHAFCINTVPTNKENVHTILHRIGHRIHSIQSKYQITQMPFSSVFLKSLQANAWNITWHMHHYLLLDNTWLYSSFLMIPQNLVIISCCSWIHGRNHNCGCNLWFQDRKVISFDT